MRVHQGVTKATRRQSAFHLFCLLNVPFLKWIHHSNRLPPELRLSMPHRRSSSNTKFGNKNIYTRQMPSETDSSFVLPSVANTSAGETLPGSISMVVERQRRCVCACIHIDNVSSWLSQPFVVTYCIRLLWMVDGRSEFIPFRANFRFIRSVFAQLDRSSAYTRECFSSRLVRFFTGTFHSRNFAELNI